MVVYDEIRITTRREINICRRAIRDLEKVIRGLEEKYHCVGAAVFDDAALPAGIGAADLSRWRNSRLALNRCRDRLQEHLRIMEM